MGIMNQAKVHTLDLQCLASNSAKEIILIQTPPKLPE